MLSSCDLCDSSKSLTAWLISRRRGEGGGSSICLGKSCLVGSLKDAALLLCSDLLQSMKADSFSVRRGKRDKRRKSCNRAVWIVRSTPCNFLYMALWLFVDFLGALRRLDVQFTAKTHSLYFSVASSATCFALMTCSGAALLNICKTLGIMD